MNHLIFIKILMMFFLCLILNNKVYAEFKNNINSVREKIELSKYDYVIEYFEKYNGDMFEKNIDKFHYMIINGVLNRILNNFNDSYDFLFASANYIHGSNDASLISWLYREIGMLHYSSNNFVQANKYFYKSKEWGDKDFSHKNYENDYTKILIELVNSRLGKPNDSLKNLQKFTTSDNIKISTLAWYAMAKIYSIIDNNKMIQAISELEKGVLSGGESLYINKDIFDIESALMISESLSSNNKNYEKYLNILRSKIILLVNASNDVNKVKKLARYQASVKRILMSLLASYDGKNSNELFEFAQFLRINTVSTSFARGSRRIPSPQNGIALLTLSDLQAKLGENEAIVQYVFGQSGGYGNFYKNGYVICITKKKFGIIPLNVDTVDVKNNVKTLRESLNLQNMNLNFQCNVAYNIYKDVFSDVENFIGQKKKIFILTDGPLDKIPFNILLTQKVSSVKDYRDLPWFIKKYSSVVLPSYQIFSSSSKKHKSKNKKFVAFADPVLGVGTNNFRGITIESLYKQRFPINDSFLAGLPSLPETSREVKAIADILTNGNDSSLYLRENCSEENLRNISFSDIDILIFATHGLVSGDFSWLRQPALVLTPFSREDYDNDGLLTCDEISNLKIDANLVILSACNTAADDGSENAVGLSGLAQSFFYAGAKNVLVSHWSVESNSVVLITQYLSEYHKKNPDDDYSESLRKAMLRVMNDHYPSPSFWGPFVLSGVN